MTISKKLTIGIVSPADWIEPEILEQGKAALEARGFGAVIHPHCFQQSGRFAGSDSVRAAALNEFYADKNIDIMLAAKGGYGSIRLLRLLDFASIEQNPKPLCGSSDNTTIINAIFAKTGVAGFISPMLRDFVTLKSDTGLEQFSKLLTGELFSQEKTIGGNFAAFMSLLGSDYMPRPTGKILVLEEISEPIYKIDRWFQQLLNANYLQELKGVRIGWFKNIGDSPIRPSGFDLNDVLSEVETFLPYTIERDFAFGHGVNSNTIRIG